MTTHPTTSTLFALLLALVISSLSASAETADPITGLIPPKATAAPAQYSPLFAGRGDGVTTCPVTGEKITGKNLKLDLHGRTVYFCCHGCLKAARQLPDKYVKPTLAEQRQAVKAFLANADAVDQAEFCNE